MKTLKNEVKSWKHHKNKQISAQNHHQTTIVASLYIISDKIWQALSSNGPIWNLSHLHIHEYQWNFKMREKTIG